MRSIAAAIVFIVLAGLSLLGRDALHQERIAAEAAAYEDLLNQELAARNYYGGAVLLKAIENGMPPISMNHANDPIAIPPSATFLHDIAAVTEGEDTELLFYSPLPFIGRDAPPLDPLREAAWDALNAAPDTLFVEETEDEDGTVLRVAIADIMVHRVCTDCHNTHPMSPRKDWEVGDVRGVLEIRARRDANNASHADRLLLIAAALSAFGAVVSLGGTFRRKDV